jgi:SAM-dependent methyltransferase
MDPRPAISEIALIYPSSYPTFKAGTGRLARMLARIKDRVLLARFEAFATSKQQNLSLLDVGCGDGRFLLTLRRHFPLARLAGLDWDFAPHVAHQLRSANIVMYTGTIEETILPLQCFDIITLNQLIEHVWDVQLVLRRCFDALKPGGRLAIETPNPGGWDRRFFRTGAWGAYYWPRHLNLFSRQHLTELVESVGMVTDFTAWLVAPPCWINSFRYTACRAGVPRRIAAALFSDNSLIWLALFTIVDRAAIAVGVETSNQKLVARRPATDRVPAPGPGEASEAPSNS